MFIGVTGSLCSGRSEIASYLEQVHSFTRLYLSISSEHNSFSSPAELLHYVTTKWRQNFVTTDLDNKELVEKYSKRPFFLLVTVDGPVLLRYQRYKSKYSNTISLENFLSLSDENLYKPKTGIAQLFHSSPLHILNTYSTIPSLRIHLDVLDLRLTTRLRPNWDTYFMKLAHLASQRSNCMKRRVGCVLVSNNRVIATGYNGTPRNIKNCNEGGCERCNSGIGSGQGLGNCFCLHAEENALLEAGQERISGAVIYCDTCPCITCSVKIVQTGVREVVYNIEYTVDRTAARILREGGVVLRQYILEDQLANKVDELRITENRF
ncbi:Deoxycytidylate deaminase [Neolecta irregularis DAH-3]|uniref:Deoxycytidylate deaminase n=1 Tax=Neolecta irregularis (strain DAH-3) TaxID=1198029 RepID=A0A1U7LKF5_NEOID|nr:Deoxycytidylate deaminase [Neolecta irregularis DAH-3]|eukprot:OLL23135.1 Deoxycytidylate deaminase [Neolecta irregularis DAH-3]